MTQSSCIGLLILSWERSRCPTYLTHLLAVNMLCFCMILILTGANKLYQSRTSTKGLCIYASVSAYDTSHLSKISCRIKNYEENIDKRNLFIVNLKPFYESVLAGDLTPFEEFKVQIQQELKERDVTYCC